MLESWLIQSRSHALNREAGSLVPIYSSIFKRNLEVFNFFIRFYYFVKSIFIFIADFLFLYPHFRLTGYVYIVWLFILLGVVCLTAVPHSYAIGLYLTIV